MSNKQLQKPTGKQLDEPKRYVVPNTFYRELLDLSMERGYLDYISQRSHFPQKKGFQMLPKATWLQITRLPVHPDSSANFDLFNRWQGVLSSLHAWGYRFLFLLQRKEGRTHLYLGTVSTNPLVTPQMAIEQVKEASSGNMPGVELQMVSDQKAASEIGITLQGYSCMGAVTGLPSFTADSGPGVLQTLDSLAFGIQGVQGEDRPYSLLVMADPISDSGINEIINKMRAIGSEIHSDVERRVNESENTNRTHSRSQGTSQNISEQNAPEKSVGGVLGSVSALGLAAAVSAGAIAVPAGAATGAAALVAALAASPFVAHSLGRELGESAESLLRTVAGKMLHKDLKKKVVNTSNGVNQSTSHSETKGFSFSIDTSYLDKYAQYAEELTEKHISRLQQGRNLGYWNVGVYVFGENRQDINTVNGMLRSIYSGRESYLEPIRLHILKEASGAIDIVRRGFNMVPLYNDSDPQMTEADEWHVFGRSYQYLSTPMNTKELALTTSLPRRDVPGLRFVKTAVRFANNPPPTTGDTICLGNLVDMGVEQQQEYRIEPDILVKHSFIGGSTGSGKSCSSKCIVKELLDKKIPVLIIEPAKDDYVRWAIEMNKSLPEDMRFQIFMPGRTEFNGQTLQQLELNPFEPASVKNAPVDMMARCENLIALLNASLPVSDILPVLMDETVYNLYRMMYGDEFTDGFPMKPQKEYPVMAELVTMAKVIMKHKEYEPKVASNLLACLETRFQYLTRGTRGRLLNVKRSTDCHRLFTRPTVINISGISSAKDKALIMSVLMLSLYEYRKSIYENDESYRRRADQNHLQHLTLVEEAHNVLTKPDMDHGGTGNPQQVVASLFSNMLSEIRGYGEGLLIVDQVPSRLIPDVIKNTNYKIVHRLTAPDDCELMASCLALRNEQKALIPALPVGHAIVYGDKDDAAAWVHMDPKNLRK